MARFYLHLVDDGRHIEDPEGSELPDEAAAYAEALLAARHLWAAALLEHRDIGLSRFEIFDESHKLVRIVSFDEALPLSLQKRLEQ